MTSKSTLDKVHTSAGLPPKPDLTRTWFVAGIKVVLKACEGVKLIWFPSHSFHILEVSITETDVRDE